MHVFQALEDLVDDVLFVDVLENVGSNDGVQICVHEVEHQVDISVVLGSDHVLQSDYVFVAGQLLQKDNLSEGSLGVSRVLESIEVLFEGHDLFSSLVDGFPHDSIRTLSCRKQSKQSQPVLLTIEASAKMQFKFVLLLPAPGNCSCQA